MPPHLNRFPSGPTLPYHQQQFQTHGPQSHPSHQPLAGSHSYMGANSQLAFQGASNGGQMGGGGGMNGAGAFMDAGRLAFQGAGFQQQHGQGQHGGLAEYPQAATRAHPNKSKIREVWKSNLEQEFVTIRNLVDHFPIVAMSLEFPGIVGRPMGAFKGKADYHYQCLRVNVDMLSVIQVGITLYNEAGESPGRSQEYQKHVEGVIGVQQASQVPSTWQFNFKFNPDDDMCNDQLIAGMRSAGVDFDKAEREGITPNAFAALLTSSGLVLVPNIRWVSFHGGYDFGYLVRLLRDVDMPEEETDYRGWMKTFFPETYDVKYIIKQAMKTLGGQNCDPAAAEIFNKLDHKNTLEAVADALKMKRVSAAHHAGSNSIITGKLFFFLRDRIFHGSMPPEYLNQVFGLGNPEHITYNPPNPNPNPNAGNDDAGPSNASANGNPSTPNNAPIGLASTPTPHNMGGAGQGLMTPGGGGGVFGNFAFNPSAPR